MQRVQAPGSVHAADWPITQTETVQIAQGAEGLEFVTPFWKTLDEQASDPITHSSWTKSWILSQNLVPRCTFVLAAHEAHEMALAVLMKQGGYYCLPGAEELTEPVDFPHTSDPAILDRLCTNVAKLPHPVHLDRILATSATIAAMERAYRGRGKVFVRPAKPYPFLLMNSSFQEPERHLSPRRRGDLLRAFRRAKEMGEVTTSFVTPSPDQVPALFEEAFRVEAESWKGRAGTAILHDPARKAFFQRYALEAAKRGLLRLGFLRIGGRDAAMQVAVVHGQRYWLLKIGYDETFARASPGILLLAESLRHAALGNLVSYEFLGAVAPWIKVWTPFERPCVTVTGYPATLVGLSLLSARVASRVWLGAGRRFSSWWASIPA